MEERVLRMRQLIHVGRSSKSPDSCTDLSRSISASLRVATSIRRSIAASTPQQGVYILLTILSDSNPWPQKELRLRVAYCHFNTNFRRVCDMHARSPPWPKTRLARTARYLCYMVLYELHQITTSPGNPNWPRQTLTRRRRGAKVSSPVVLGAHNLT